MFKILTEVSIGSGIRRIEAVTGEKALKYAQNLEEIVNVLSEKLKCSSAELAQKVDDLMRELKQKNQEIRQAKQNDALINVQESSKTDAVIYFLTVSGYDMNELRSICEAIKSQKPSGIIIVANYSGDKVSLIISIDPILQRKYNARRLLEHGLVPLRGKGGGNVAFAQGGGEGKDRIAEAIEAIKNAVS